ncbi:hypothetical protein [Bacillus sp. FJAT-22090]|uniref:hypothetical protein n=1 Tax=Bacillus sp. FJAT-22090 TaxID=1581038 RepID=UPI0011A0135F|nr:hypothetical protein [Bacillus sp. FJAT-22090]
MTINHSIKTLEQEERTLMDDLDVLNSVNARDELKQETITKLRNVRASIVVLNEKADSINRYTEEGGIFLSNDGGILITGKITIKSNQDLSKPKTKEEALKYLKEYNENVKPEHAITRLRYNNGKNYVQDLSYFTHPAYMSKGLLEALQNGQTLTDDLEKEFNSFIMEKSV